MATEARGRERIEPRKWGRKTWKLIKGKENMEIKRKEPLHSQVDADSRQLNITIEDVLCPAGRPSG